MLVWGRQRCQRSYVCWSGQRRQESPFNSRLMRKLLIVTNAFPPCPAPGSARAWRLYNYLPEFGYETYVVTGSRPDKTQPRVTWVPVPSRNFGERVLRKFVFPFDDDIQWTL